MALTGPLSPNGKSALLGMKIWEEEINAKGGLLGRPVKLVYYDDQSQAAPVPGIYTKLIDVDKVDLVIGPYATVPAAAAMPVIMQKGKVFIILFGLGGEHRVQLPEILRDDPVGTGHQAGLHGGFLRCGGGAEPQAADGGVRRRRPEFSNNACDGARDNAKKHGLQDRLRPHLSADHDRFLADRARDPGRQSGHRRRSAPIRSTRSAWCKSVNELELQAEDDRRRDGRPAGDRVQDPARPVAQRLGQLRDLGAVEADDVPSTEAFLKTYQARAGAEGVDPLGYYLGTWGYAYIQVLGDAVQATKSLNDNTLADYIGKTTFKTIMGDVKFGKGGEWAKGRMLQVQYHGIKSSELDQFKGMDTQTVLTPGDLKTGDVIYPFEKAK